MRRRSQLTRPRHLVGCIYLFLVLLLVALPAVGSQEAERLPAETVVPLGSPDSGARIVFRHELINDPDESALFGIPGDVAVGEDSRLYYVDPMDRTIHVLDETGSHIQDIGTAGQGPGELQTPWLVNVSSDGKIYVFERAPLRFSVFRADGQFIDTIDAGDYQLRRAKSVLIKGASTVVVSGASLHPDLIGQGIHVFSVQETSPRGRSLVHVRSFSETESLDPVLYNQVAGGAATFDLDGSILYTQRAPYSVRKFTTEGELLWRIDDEELIPPATEAFGVNRHGRLEAAQYPYAAAILPLEQDLYLHMMMFPLLEQPQEEPAEPQPKLTRSVFELIRRVDGAIQRTRFDLPDHLLYYERDAEGRLYGYLMGAQEVKVIRSTVSIDGYWLAGIERFDGAFRRLTEGTRRRP